MYNIHYDMNCVKYKMQTFSTNLLVRIFSVNEVSAGYLASHPKILETVRLRRFPHQKIR